MPADQLAAVKAAWARHGVVWFPDQPLDHDQLEAFTLQFGDFGLDPYVKPLADRPHILEVRREPDETNSVFGGAWHSDWSFQPMPPSFTLLWSVDVPPHGGDTMWSNQELAFDTLSAGLQDTLLGPDLSIAGSGQFEADGTAALLDLTVAGSGNASMAELLIDTAKVSIAGSGNVVFACDGAVNAHLMGSGMVTVRGAARCKVQSVGSGCLVCEPRATSEHGQAA